MKIFNMRLNNIDRPMGFNVDYLSFSWCVEAEDTEKFQSAARIQIYEEQGNTLVFDSGLDKNADNRDYLIMYKPKPRMRYRWVLSVLADNDVIAKDERWFETGKMFEKWSGQWITPDLPQSVHPTFIKDFRLDKQVKKARAYICGLGVYELYVNGEKVCDEFLAPGYHSYDLHLQTYTYDITPYLLLGNNTIEVMLGNGWFKGRFGFDGGYTNTYGDKFYLIGEFHVALCDGTEMVVDTEDSWESYHSCIVESNIYDGEIYDARRMTSKRAGVMLEEPKKCGKLCDRYSLPILKKESFPVLDVIYTKDKDIVLDFGQNITGWVEFRCHIKKGTQIKLTASEFMQKGKFYRDNLRSAKAEFVYISDGTERHVRPHFTFFGFRYMKVECEESINKDDFVAYHLRSDFDQIGEIVTGNNKVNKLFQNALWGQKDNFLDVPTDCPQRDERLGWTGDAQVFSNTACYNMYVPAFFRKYMWDMRAEQQLVGGAGVNVVPRLKKGMAAEYGICPWADAATIIPWNVYVQYGSKSLLKEQYPGMKSWVDYQEKRGIENGNEFLVNDGFHFADWLALDNKKPGPLGATDPLFIASVYYYYSANILAKSAEILGYQKDKIKYQNLAEHILNAIRETYFENGRCVCETQTAQALTIMFGLSSEKQQIAQTLTSLIERNENHLDTGFVGTPLLCPALSNTGHHKEAIDLLLNEQYPGWLYQVNLGATTIWERWNSVLEDGTMNSEGMNSLNHYSYGSIEEWMYQYVCGLKSSEEFAGYKKAIIKPHPDRRLGYAKAKLCTASGNYVSGWYYDKEKIIYEFEIPFNCEAEVELKDGRLMKLICGKYQF